MVSTSVKAMAATNYLKVSGAEALKDQDINQYDDSENPPQGYIVKLPTGYTLYSSQVDTQDTPAVCGVSAYDHKTETIKIDGFYLETDAGRCDVILDLYNQDTKTHKKVTYSIEQVGT